jgi:hypothetical protein
VRLEARRLRGDDSGRCLWGLGSKLKAQGSGRCLVGAYAMLPYVMDGMVRYATLCYLTLCYEAKRYLTPGYATLC